MATAQRQSLAFSLAQGMQVYTQTCIYHSVHPELFLKILVQIPEPKWCGLRSTDASSYRSIDFSGERRGLRPPAVFNG